MTNRQSIHIALLLWGSIFCLLAFFCMYLSREIDHKKKKYMLFMLLSSAILLSSDAVAWGFRGMAGSMARHMVYTSNFLVFLFSDILLLLYHGYVCSWIFEKNSEEKRKNYRVNVVYAICAAAILLVCVSQVTHQYYYIDAQNYYHRNPGYYISLFLPMLGMLLDLSLLIQFRKNLTRGILAGLVSYIVLPFAAAIVLFFYYGISLINIAISISVILMFLETMIEQGKMVAAQERQLSEKNLKLAVQERQLARTERELTDSRIASMMSQIRNHFIFNVLGTISTYCKTDPNKADEALTKFARYLRRNINYLETTNFKIPPLTVQPLVENAIKHGLTKPGRKGTVCVLTRQEKDGIIIEVTDNGIGFDTDDLEKKGSVGIKNIRYRLEHMAGATLQIESRLGEGTKAAIRIPVQQEKE